jgi:hypothetical protein
MQFLSDVYLRCAQCDGRRYRPEVLEVRLWPDAGEDPPRSMADVLELTVSEARGFFAGNTQVRQALTPLQEVGLDYLRLGQPVPTLSGGEAQRLKLAGHLAKAGKRRRAHREDEPRGDLFLLDEPTTGLHFDDIARLLKLDLIRAADWVIDLGPGGGEAGGEILCAGTPREIAPLPGEPYGRGPAGLWGPAGAEPADPRSPCWGGGEGGRARAYAFTTRASTISRTSMSAFPGGDSRSSPASAAAARAQWPSISCLTRTSAAIWNPSTAMPASSYSPPRARMWMQSMASRPRWPSSSAAPGGAQEHGGHGHRDPPFPAPAVRQAGHPVLSGLRAAHPAPVPGCDTGQGPAGIPGSSYHGAGPPSDGTQGLLHRAGPVGRCPRPRPAAGGRAASAHRALAEVGPLQ